MGALLSLVSGTLAFIELSASGLPSILKWVGGAYTAWSFAPEL